MAVLGMFLSFHQFSTDTQHGKYLLKKVGLSAHAAKKEDASIIAIVPPFSLQFSLHKLNGTTRTSVLVNTITTAGDGAIQLSPNFPSACDVPESARGACAGGVVDGAAAPLGTYTESIHAAIVLLRKMRLAHQVANSPTPIVNLASWNATVQKVTAATAAVLVAAKAIDEENARALVRHARKQAALRKAARENAQHVLQHSQLLQAQEDLKMRQLLALQELPGRKKRKLLDDSTMDGMFGGPSGPLVGGSASASSAAGIQDVLPPAMVPAPLIVAPVPSIPEVDLPDEAAALKWLHQRRQRIQVCEQKIDEEDRDKDWQAELHKAKRQETDVLRVLQNFKHARGEDD